MGYTLEQPQKSSMRKKFYTKPLNWKLMRGIVRLARARGNITLQN